jgi:hypothetical protein
MPITSEIVSQDCKRVRDYMQDFLFTEFIYQRVYITTLIDELSHTCGTRGLQVHLSQMRRLSPRVIWILRKQSFQKAKLSESQSQN